MKPAFPTKDTNRYGDVWYEAGMTMRDYLAAKALQGILARNDPLESPESLAKMCFRIADAMLAEQDGEGNA